MTNIGSRSLTGSTLSILTYVPNASSCIFCCYCCSWLAAETLVEFSSLPAVTLKVGEDVGERTNTRLLQQTMQRHTRVSEHTVAGPLLVNAKACIFASGLNGCSKGSKNSYSNCKKSWRMVSEPELSHSSHFQLYHIFLQLIVSSRDSRLKRAGKNSKETYIGRFLCLHKWQVSKDLHSC